MNRLRPCLNAGPRSPENGQTRRTFHGFTLVEIMIVVTIIAFLSAIALPGWTRYRNTTAISTCLNNLRQLNSAKVQWAFNERKVNEDVPVMADLLPYLLGHVEPRCPGGGTYNVLRTMDSTTCTMAVFGHSLE
jgi:prepilin-type N-terminal cleavage/methylation domain-containing protein